MVVSGIRDLQLRNPLNIRSNRTSLNRPGGSKIFSVFSRPGIIETDMTLLVRERYDTLIEDGLVPARRWGYPGDVAAIVSAMTAGRLPYTVGQAVTVDGGLTIPRF